MAILVMSSPLPSGPYVQALRAAVAGSADAGLPVWNETDAHDPAAVEAILAWRMPAGVLARYPNLRVLSSMAAGVDKLLTAPDLLPGVAVTRVLDPLQGAEMAQYVLAVTLGFTRQLGLYAAQQARAEWRRHPVRKPAQCRIGVLGMGAMGQAIARAFVPLGYPVAGFGRSPRDAGPVTPFAETHAGTAELPRFLARTDVLVCALPLTPETRGLLARDTLSQLPRGAFLVSLGRGEQVVEADLRALLDEGHLAGAALDVYEREPPSAANWVWSHPKVVATPHIAAEADVATAARQCLDALQRARAGLPQALAVNRSAGY